MFMIKGDQKSYIIYILLLQVHNIERNRVTKEKNKCDIIIDLDRYHLGWNKVTKGKKMI